MQSNKEQRDTRWIPRRIERFTIHHTQSRNGVVNLHTAKLSLRLGRDVIGPEREVKNDTLQPAIFWTQQTVVLEDPNATQSITSHMTIDNFSVISVTSRQFSLPRLS